MNEPISEERRRDTYARHLQEEGYHTALIGKHHYIDRFAVGMDVLEDDETIRGYGYDHVWQVVDDHLRNQDTYTRFLDEIGKLELFQGMTRRGAYDHDALTPAEFDDGYIGETAAAYIANYRGTGPLYLQVGFLGPHPPHWVAGEYAEMYDPATVPSPRGVPLGAQGAAQRERALKRRAAYLGRVSLIDHYVGRLLQELEKRSMLGNTLVVFSADHGDSLGDRGIWDKRFFFEQSAGVPLVMAGPGVEINSRLGGGVCKALVSGVDLYPTFLDAAGAENLLGAGQREGRSLFGVLEDRAPLRSEVYSELGTAMMVRDANWKLVYDAEQDGVQYLFNLRRDPEELDNLAGAAGYREVEARYVDKLLSRLIRMTHFTHDKERRRVQRVRV
jgi:choline-sulfatase